MGRVRDVLLLALGVLVCVLLLITLAHYVTLTFTPPKVVRRPTYVSLGEGRYVNYAIPCRGPAILMDEENVSNVINSSSEVTEKVFRVNEVASIKVRVRVVSELVEYAEYAKFIYVKPVNKTVGIVLGGGEGVVKYLGSRRVVKYELLGPAYVIINYSTYSRIWREEHLSRKEDPFAGYLTGRVLTTEAKVCSHKLILQVPEVKGLEELRKNVEVETYIRYVLAPTLKFLVMKLGICGTLSNHSLAKAVRDFITSRGYCEGPYESIEALMAANCSGVCDDWAGLADTLADIYGWKYAYITSEGNHASSFLCEPWWKTKWAIELIYKNGTKVKCYLWVDTGYLINGWNKLGILWAATSEKHFCSQKIAKEYPDIYAHEDGLVIKVR